jgi:hypothetical protein
VQAKKVVRENPRAAEQFNGHGRRAGSEFVMNIIRQP